MQTLTLIGYGYGQSDSNWFYRKVEADTITPAMAQEAIMAGVNDGSLASMRAEYTVNGVTRKYILTPTKDRKGYTKLKIGV